MAVRLPSRELPALRRSLLVWHRKHGQPAPWRESGDPYQVLVAAVMAQQTQMSRVLPKFDEFIAAFPTVDALAAAPAANVLRRWAPLGYNLRALRLHRAAQLIARRGRFPCSAAELQQIDGVGPCTAAVIASFAYAQPAPAIDTNVRRIIERVVGADELNDGTLLDVAGTLISRRAPGRWNQALMDLGATVCTARTPRCNACPLARWCRSRRRFSKRTRRVAETRAFYRTQVPFHGSRRYYRGRIVQALRELPPGASLSHRNLLDALPHRDGLDAATLADIIESLKRDGLVRVLASGCLRLP
jgi:A/G-specific adenine glycosylase